MLGRTGAAFPLQSARGFLQLSEFCSNLSTKMCSVHSGHEWVTKKRTRLVLSIRPWTDSSSVYRIQ